MNCEGCKNQTVRVIILLIAQFFPFRPVWLTWVCFMPEYACFSLFYVYDVNALSDLRN